MGRRLQSSAQLLFYMFGVRGQLGSQYTFVGPGYSAVDTSIFKNIRISDRFSVQFRAEAFNVFSQTNFELADPSGPLETANLENPKFGQAGGTFPPRNLQFGLKLTF